ncbi:MAG TPA: CsbD family protein [Anaerolineaceae bacterium]|nr:CsbD family protein [Anaerolineaceae bacterium]
MNNNVSKGKWKQIRGQTKVWWGKLTHNNSQKIGGNIDKITGKIQEKVGNSQERAKKG